MTTATLTPDRPATHGASLEDRHTVREVARYKRVTDKTIYNWIQSGTLPAKKVGKQWLIRREDLLRVEEEE